MPRWFSAEALQPITDLNRRMLALMVDEPAALIVADEITDALRALSASALERIAQCPCLLITAGFDDERRWNEAKELAAQFKAAGTTRKRGARAAVSLARGALFIAWYYARTYPDAAELVIGTHPGSAQALSRLTMEDLEHLAAAHSDWVQPRWANSRACWEELLTASQTNTRPFAADLRGLQLILGERLRTAAQLHKQRV